MKNLNQIPFKILITVLVAGVIGVVGMLVLKYDIDRLADSYEVIIDEHMDNQNDMNDISKRLYYHQMLISSYLYEGNEENFDSVRAEEEQLSTSVKKSLSDLGKRLKGSENERERLYHKVYSNTYSYLQNADIVNELVERDSANTAAYYITSVMSSFIREINEDLDDLEELTAYEMEDARRQMEHYISLSQLSEVVCVGGIIAVTLISALFCVSMVTKLDRYKQNLEVEIEDKNRELLEHAERMVNMQDNIIVGMASLIESRDGETGGHVKRTSAYVKLLAEQACREGYGKDILNSDYIELLVKAAPMHDVGKITISDAILCKPGKLTPEEFDIMKTHAAEGGSIIREVLGGIEEKEYVDIASRVASYHHEKWDGSGYPEGMKGEDIPLCARIMAVADVFDALVSKRCYKEAMSVDEAFSVIEESAGSHFDPVLAQIFLSLRPAVEQVVEKYAEM